MSKARVDTTRPVDEAIETIANPLARATVSALDDLPAPVPVENLASTATAEVTDDADATEEFRDSVVVRLHHAQVPKLASAGLLDWDDDEGVVEPTDHPALSDTRFRAMAAVDAEDWDDVLAALSATRRRHALDVLRSIAGDADRRALVRRVLADERGVAVDDVPTADVEEALVTFHHVHLPALERADLVTTADGRVGYDGHPALEPEWLRFGVDRPDRPTRGSGTSQPTVTVDREHLVVPGDGPHGSQD